MDGYNESLAQSFPSKIPDSLKKKKNKPFIVLQKGEKSEEEAMAELPCDADGLCMICKTTPPDSDVLLCNSCCSPWHMPCLKVPLHTVPLGDWHCPDCSFIAPNVESQSAHKEAISKPAQSTGLVAQIRAIQADSALTEEEKARKCQNLVSRGTGEELNRGIGESEKKKHKMLEIFDENLNCAFCMQLAERPVTTPCGHNFCLKCFQRWIAQGRKNCVKCRALIPAKMASQPRINSALVIAIRMAKSAVNPSTVSGPPKPYYYIQNQDRPDKAFTTERAKRAGKANAASGKIFVTVPPDHFGPITAENDPVRNQGVLVGETWEDRMECRQWGAHLPHVAGIAGQSDYGAQSVALSGGYEDDEDHGEWFLYTGSGGRDLSGNRRTNDKQSFDQKFDKSNEALRVSCKRGYPVRVVRSHKEKRSSYAPESGVRYDGIYRIEKCWRKIGIQGFKVCRYLFVRCDNEPASWTSDEHGDRPRPLPKIDELKAATDVTERKGEPAWDWKPEEGRWGWTIAPPSSRKNEDGSGASRQGHRKSLSIGQRLLKEFGCSLCKKVLRAPLSTPCGHNFCKACVEAVFAGQKDVRERAGVGGRPLRVQKVIKRCPSCQGDITDFLLNPQVNRQMEGVIESLKHNGDEDSDMEQDGEKVEEQEDSVKLTATEPENTPKLPNATGIECQDKEKSSICITDTDADVCANGDHNDESRMAEHSEPDKRDEHLNAAKMDNIMSSGAFEELCCKYPEYSKELLQSMLIDQEGDVVELGHLLKALKRQEKAKTSSKSKDAKDAEGTEVHKMDVMQMGSDYNGDALSQGKSGEMKGKGGRVRIEPSSGVSSANAIRHHEGDGEDDEDGRVDDTPRAKRLCLRKRINSREGSSDSSTLKANTESIIVIS